MFRRSISIVLIFLLGAHHAISKANNSISRLIVSVVGSSDLAVKEELTDSMDTVGDAGEVRTLDEVVVSQNLLSVTDNGYVYRMDSNKRAQSENTLQALSYVPLLNVKPDGTISVNGSESYSLFINGRPDEMAQRSPKEFLQSLPAASIARIEIITNPDNTYGADVKGYILNIITKKPFLEGYAVNLDAQGNTQPSADGTITGMFKNRKIDFSIAYNYNYYGQRNQPGDITYLGKNMDGETEDITRIDMTGNGDWHNHTLRAMLKWKPDTLNSLYADVHGLISRTNMTMSNLLNGKMSVPVAKDVMLDNTSAYTSGSTEANIVYRNYSPDSPSTERITAGYHFTYNPDKRSIIQRRSMAGTAPDILSQRTNGGMAEHSAILSRLFRLKKSFLRLTLREDYRRGKTSSEYELSDQSQLPSNSMKYDNLISNLSVSWGGRIGRVMIIAGLKGNLDWFRMKLPESPDMDYSRTRFYLLPSASFSWRPAVNDNLYLSYSSSIRRPGVEMLNPFTSSTDDISISTGNPDLKAQYTHSVSLSWLTGRVKNLMLSTSLEYNHCKDEILPATDVSDGKMISSYANIGKSNDLGLTAIASWRPANWTSVSVNGKIGERWLESKAIGLRQDNFYYQITSRIDFYLPHHFRIGAQYGHYKNLPEPWSTISELNIYSFNASKSFLDGRLTITATASSPFNKYTHSRVCSNLPAMQSIQNNYIIGRSFGLGISYSFGSGKQVDIERDNTLESKDLDTGVR